MKGNSWLKAEVVVCLYPLPGKKIPLVSRILCDVKMWQWAVQIRVSWDEVNHAKDKQQAAHAELDYVGVKLADASLKLSLSQ